MGRLIAIMTKELLSTLRDPRARISLILPPILQLLIFSLATTLEVKNFSVGVLDSSGGQQSVEFVERLAGSPNVGRIVRLASPAALANAINRQQVIAAVVLDARFDRDMAAHRPATIGVILDGRRTNAAQIVNGYIGQIAAGMGAQTVPTGGGTIVRNAFNPNLDYIWFTLPSLIVVICAISGMSVTAQSVARERELGTFEQLMVSPLRTHEILIGKMTPPLLIGLFNGALYVVAATTVFGVPFTGNLALFFLTLILYMLAIIGIGMLVSTLAGTQQQAFLGSFLLSVPIILLSGYASPVDNMPEWLQIIGLADPARHYLVIVEALFLKAPPAAVIWANSWPLIIIATVTLSAAAWLFRARRE